MNFITSELGIVGDKGIYAIYFYSPWLIYHKKMMAMFGKIADKYKDISCVCVDASSFKKTAIIYDITSIPTVVVFNNGKEINRITGVCLTSAFKAFFDDIYKKVKKESLHEK